MSEFGPIYSNQYDSLYGDKDYAAECNLLEAAFQRYASQSVHTILDLGCGTGSHAFELARRGYPVTGVDRSADMLAKAQVKLEALPTGVPIPKFIHGDIKSTDLRERFDTVLMMFAVLGYQLENADVLAALQTARRHLAPSGLLIFDVWYGPAVLHLRPGERLKTLPSGNGTLLRSATGSLDVLHQQAEVRYHLWLFDEVRLLSETEESHRMRYFFPQELAFYLTQSGFEMVHLSAFGNLDEPASEESWNVLTVARAAA